MDQETGWLNELSPDGAARCRVGNDVEEQCGAQKGGCGGGPGDEREGSAGEEDPRALEDRREKKPEEACHCGEYGPDEPYMHVKCRVDGVGSDGHDGRDGGADKLHGDGAS